MAQASEQQAALSVHVVPGGAQEGPSSPESGGPVMQQVLSCSPQLFKQLPEQPVLVQQVLPLVQTAPPAQLQGWVTPHESATETLHWLPQLLVGAQHLPADVHSWPLAHSPLH